MTGLGSKDKPDKDPDLSAAIASLENAVKQLTQKIVRRYLFFSTGEVVKFYFLSAVLASACVGDCEWTYISSVWTRIMARLIYLNTACRFEVERPRQIDV